MFISTFQFLQTLENALETEAQFYNLDSPSQFKVSYHHRTIASFTNSIIISKLRHHCCFDHQQQHLWQFIWPSVWCSRADALSALSSTATKLFSHCLLTTIPFGTKHFGSECVFSVDINGLFLTFSKSWLPLPKFRLNCLGSFFSVETYWTAGLTLKNHHNGFSIKPIQNKEIPITIMQNASIIYLENSLNWLNCKALPY